MTGNIQRRLESSLTSPGKKVCYNLSSQIILSHCFPLTFTGEKCAHVITKKHRQVERDDSCNSSRAEAYIFLCVQSSSLLLFSFLLFLCRETLTTVTV